MIKYVRNPSFYFMLMWGWFIALFVIHLLIYPIPAYFSSYIRYFGASVIIGIFMLILGFINAKTNFWKCLRLWGKVFVLIISYIISVLFVVLNSILMDTYMSAQFFDRANDSDFEMLCLPSVLFYFIISILFMVIVSISNKFRQEN